MTNSILFQVLNIKIKFSLILLLLMIHNLNGQNTLAAYTVSSGGTYSVSQDFQLHSNVGEAVVSYNLTNSNQVLNSGFLQNLETVEGCSLESEPEILQSISNQKSLRFSVDDSYTLTIFHRNGNVLYHKPYEGPVSNQVLKAGNYLYVLADAEGQPCIKSAVTIFD